MGVFTWFSGKCTSVTRLDGKTSVITGCNTGIGKVTAKDFFKRGAKVIMACRNVNKAEEALDNIIKECQGESNLGTLTIIHLDLTSLKSVRACAQKLLDSEAKIDLLVNNAGVMICPEGKTEDGFEVQFGTNHLGHFLFTLLLLPKIIASSRARIVILSSLTHAWGKIDFDDLNSNKKPYRAIASYGQSKLANVLFAKELARRLEESKITTVKVYCVHPGIIATELGRYINDTYVRGLGVLYNILARWFVKTPEQGAQTTIYCSVDEKCANETGLYYVDCAVREPSRSANDEAVAKRLWEESLILVGLEKGYNPFK